VAADHDLRGLVTPCSYSAEAPLATRRHLLETWSKGLMAAMIIPPVKVKILLR